MTHKHQSVWVLVISLLFTISTIFTPTIAEKSINQQVVEKMLITEEEQQKIEQLINELESEDWDVRNNAEESLEQMGPKVVPALRDNWGQSKNLVRFWHWISPQMPRIVAGIIIGVVTTAITQYFWGTEPAALSGIVVAIVVAWLLAEQV